MSGMWLPAPLAADFPAGCSRAQRQLPFSGHLTGMALISSSLLSPNDDVRGLQMDLVMSGI